MPRQNPERSNKSDATPRKGDARRKVRRAVKVARRRNRRK